MLIFLLAFANFNPHNVIEARKKQFLNAISDIAVIADSDSITLSYYWKNGIQKYRINVDKIGETNYHLIYDSENLWKIIPQKRKKELVSFLERANLWIYDWLYFLPHDSKWKRAKDGLALLEYDNDDVRISLFVDDLGRIMKVKIVSEFREMEIEYKDFMDLKDFPDYPERWVVRSGEIEREFKVAIIRVNKKFCTPCTFEIPKY